MARQLTVNLELLVVVERLGQLEDILDSLFESGVRHDGGLCGCL